MKKKITSVQHVDSNLLVTDAKITTCMHQPSPSLKYKLGTQITVQEKSQSDKKITPVWSETGGIIVTDQGAIEYSSSILIYPHELSFNTLMEALAPARIG